jgi:hypothetical protein
MVIFLDRELLARLGQGGGRRQPFRYPRWSFSGSWTVADEDERHRDDLTWRTFWC